ncbi:DUF1722 domain-containing protein [Hahella ganghwensis]|uniref:DUF1722 domain-containing protein n=1 Tax=Hahella ganghwensis TaxID=286420 RepID=UPI000373C4CA|nr:DUF1722 domain-containing protein [Hahella ganghwensis]
MLMTPDPGYLGTEEILKHLDTLASLLGESSLPSEDTACNRRNWNLLAAEMTIRDKLPRPFIKDWLELPLSTRLSSGGLQPPLSESARIPRPTSGHQLWAQYKYSVMARSNALYRRIGPDLASEKLDFEALRELLESTRRQPPELGGLRNAVYHMWGYVKSASQLKPDETPLPVLFREIQSLAVRHHSQYLLHSTALGEFAYWCWRLDPDNGALPSTHSTDTAC